MEREFGKGEGVWANSFQKFSQGLIICRKTEITCIQL